MVSFELKQGTKITDEEKKMLEGAKKFPLVYDEDSPEMTKEEFIQYLGMNGVSIFSFDSENEFLEDLANA